MSFAKKRAWLSWLTVGHHVADCLEHQLFHFTSSWPYPSWTEFSDSNSAPVNNGYQKAAPEVNKRHHKDYTDIKYAVYA